MVKVFGQLTRPGNGYINSRLQKKISAGATELEFEVGYEMYIHQLV